MFVDPDGMKARDYNTLEYNNMPSENSFANMNGYNNHEFIGRAGGSSDGGITAGNLDGGGYTGSGITFGQTQAYRDLMGSLSDPKPSVWNRIGSFFSNLFRGSKDSHKNGVLVVGDLTWSLEGYGAEAEVAKNTEIIAQALSALRGGVWALPLILNGDAAKTDDDKIPYVTLFRGVHADHPDLANAYMGMAIPMGGTATAEQHNYGDNNSMFTSWSTSIDVANYSASRRGVGGIILKQSFPLYRLSFFNRHAGEQEVQVFGPVAGAQIIKPWNGGTWTPYIK